MTALTFLFLATVSMADTVSTCSVETNCGLGKVTCSATASEIGNKEKAVCRALPGRATYFECLYQRVNVKDWYTYSAKFACCTKEKAPFVTSNRDEAEANCHSL